MLPSLIPLMSTINELGAFLARETDSEEKAKALDSAAATAGGPGAHAAAAGQPDT